jgi:large subunit ribosomal protein L21
MRKLFGLGLLLGVAAVYWYLRRGEPAPVEPRSPAPPQDTGAPEAASPEETVIDPLVEIEGIGPVYARRLEAAGVTTFAALAQLAPDEIRAIVKAQPWQADVDSWIRQARERV